MDCLSLSDSREYNCSNLWGENCINNSGFDFNTLWNITLKIQQYCPTDARLWLENNVPATPENAALTSEACKAFVGSGWKPYPTADIWVRLTTWKFPLLQLVASSPRPPLGFMVEAFVILHLLGDPVGTIKDLLQVISTCQRRADFWRAYLVRRSADRRPLTTFQVERAWKAFTIITISYDEWGKGNVVQEILRSSLDGLLKSEDGTADLETFLQLCNLTADALAADRATKFLPIIVAQGFFVGAIAVAIAKITANTSSTSFFINVEAHSIAFSALYFWILPAVFLSSVIGVSQTQNAVPRILRRFRTGFDHELSHKNIKLPNNVLDDELRRAANGGIYSWLPDQPGIYESKRFLPMFRRNALPLLIVISAAVTAWLVSGYVPPEGWQTRHCAEAVILLTWLLSFCLTCVLKRYTSSCSYNTRGRFWLTFAKDLAATIATMGGIIVTQIGIFNRCDSYTLWGRTGLALPNMPNIAGILALRIGTVYPAIVFVSIPLQMFLIPIIIAIWYRHALLVFLQRDDEASNPFLDWIARTFGSSGRAAAERRRRKIHTFDSDPDPLTGIAMINLRLSFEDVDLGAAEQRGHQLDGDGHEGERETGV